MESTKHGSIWIYQPQDQIYFGRDNKNYFDRGSYARPWPIIQLHEGYVSTTDTSLNIQAVSCGTYAQLASSSGFDLVSSVNGVNTFRWWLSLPIASVKRSYFLRILSSTGGVFKTKFIYSGSSQPTNATLGIQGRERGILVKLSENAILRRITMPVNITTLNNPVTIKVYRVDPHNSKSKKLLATYVNGTYTGSVGNTNMIFNLDSNPVAAFGWNPGDSLLVTITINPADSMTLSYFTGSGLFNPNGYYWDAVNDISPDIQLPTWRVEAYDGLYSEMLVESNDLLTMIKYSNNRLFDLVPPNKEQVTYMRGNFWQPNYPAEFEDIEILPGQFTRIRNEWNRTRQFETDYMPGYAHENFQHILGCDNINIDGTDVIQRNAYEMPFTDRQYGLAKGKVLLTEKRSIIRNIVGKVVTIPYVAVNPEYAAILDVATLFGMAKPSIKCQIKQDDLITQMKALGVWDNLDIFYNFYCDGDENFAKINWKNPKAPFAQSFSMAFYSFGGFLGNGVNGYMDTKFSPLNAVKYQINNAMFAIGYNLLNQVFASLEGCADGGGTNHSIMRPLPAANTAEVIVNSHGSWNFIDGSIGPAPGICFCSRADVNTTRFRKNNNASLSAVVVSSNRTANSFYLGAVNQAGVTTGFTTNQYSMFMAGTYMLDKEVAFYNAWTQYQSGL